MLVEAQEIGVVPTIGPQSAQTDSAASSFDVVFSLAIFDKHSSQPFRIAYRHRNYEEPSHLVGVGGPGVGVGEPSPKELIGRKTGRLAGPCEDPRKDLLELG